MNLRYNAGIKVGRCVTIALLLITTLFFRGETCAMTTLNVISNQIENQEFKVCTKCGVEKQRQEFGNDKYSKDGSSAYCKECNRKSAKKIYENNKKKILEAGKEYRDRNKESIRANKKAYYEKNKLAILESVKKYREENKDKVSLLKKISHEKNRERDLKRSRDHYYNNKAKYCLRQKEWYENNKEKHAESGKDWVKNNIDRKRAISAKYNRKIRSTPKGHLNSTISKRINESLNKGMKAGRRWETLVGYTVDQLKQHLEKQFDKDMNWENYGTLWHIDHSTPVAAFNFEKPEDEDFKKCWALGNLKPLEASKNMSKGAKLQKPFQQSFIF